MSLTNRFKISTCPTCPIALTAVDFLSVICTRNPVRKPEIRTHLPTVQTAAEPTPRALPRGRERGNPPCLLETPRHRRRFTSEPLAGRLRRLLTLNQTLVVRKGIDKLQHTALFEVDCTGNLSLQFYSSILVLRNLSENFVLCKFVGPIICSHFESFSVSTKFGVHLHNLDFSYTGLIFSNYFTYWT